MQICRELAGFSYGRADLVRRAMSKKKASVMQKEREHFIYGLKSDDGTVECAGCIANGVPESVASDIFDEMSAFAAYAFNKSHAAAYAYVAYQTAYLKCHYPKEYMAALLTSVLDNTPKVVSYIGECARLGIRILPPDVNESLEEFSATEQGIRFGLLAIKNLGRGVVHAILDAREAEGKFTDIYDFCNRLYDADLRRRSLESLIKCGACDGFNLSRRALLSGCDALLADIDRVHKANISGQVNLFDGLSDEENISHQQIAQQPEFEPAQLLKMEKEIIGLYVSGHPLLSYRELITSLPVVPISDILASAENRTDVLHDDARVNIAAVVDAKKLTITKKGDTMAYLAVEDLTGGIEILVFPRVLSQYTALTDVERLVFLSGRLSYREDEDPKLILEEARPLEEMGNAAQQAGVYANKMNQAPEKKRGKSARPGLYLKVSASGAPAWSNAQKYMAVFDGNTPVYVYFTESRQLTLAPRNLWVSLCEVLLRVLKEELGEQNVAVVE